ncbi:MAG: FAD-binding oxidoreductase [Polaromonas sp.]|nr:FAD-binding oxidoreductase [Polaromonas sp.]
MSEQADFLIIGGGIAAASVGYWLAPHGRVALLERESQPGYHSTGRSAALFMESYGTAQVRALTMASRAFFENPPAGFSEHPLVSPRGAMMVATHGEDALLAEAWDVFRSVTPHARLLSSAEACAMVPVLRPEKVLGAVLEPDAVDMDVHAIHQGFLRGLRQHGGKLVCHAEVTSLARHDERWRVEAGGQTYEAPVVINAAGAWADGVAAMAGVHTIGLEPRRRSAFIFAPPEGMNSTTWPLTAAISDSEGWYFKPDAGMLLGSPANADPVTPQDIQPEELDVAMAIHRIEEMTTLTIRRPTRTWAGLRSFVADGDLVGGFAPDAPGFFWLAAQGGYGIQTSAAMGEACAALARGLPLPERIAGFGLTEAMLSPARLQRAASDDAQASGLPH